MDEPKNADSPTPGGNPTAGRKAGFDVDENGNVTSIWFTMKVDHFVEFHDQAVIYSEKLKKPDTPDS